MHFPYQELVQALVEINNDAASISLTCFATNNYGTVKFIHLKYLLIHKHCIKKKQKPETGKSQTVSLFPAVTHL